MSSIPYEELPILEALINIRNRLTALKKDSSQYIRAQDVMQIYQQVIKQISKLNAVRDEAATSSTSSSTASSAVVSGASSNASTAAPSAAETPVSPLSPSISASSNHAAAAAAASTSASNSNITGATAALASQHQASASSSSSAADTSAPAYTTSQAGPGSSSDASPLTNRVDTTLNDVFALLSLFFLTIGKSRESPALFSQLSCMKQLLDHLAESGIYTESDLKPFADRLQELRDIIIRDGEAGRSPVQLTKLMIRKLEGCERVLHDLQGTLSVLSVELLPIHQRLINVRRQIAAAAAKPKPARTEIKLLQEELRRIDSKRVDGKFLGPGGSSVPAGQAILVGILEECFEICHDITVRNDEVPMELQPIYDRLVEIKAQLEHLVLTHRWTLRETDLWNYQVSLKEIDRLRVNGKFVDSEGKQPEGQLVLLYLLRRCYGLIYRLVASSEPISEELMPVSNKLSTVQKCLKEVSKYGGPFTARDLYPYRLALHQIDSLRAVPAGELGKDGERKWLGRDGSVPEGQAILRAQYEEVEQTIEEMLNRQEDDDDDEYEDGEEEDGDVLSASGSEADGNLSLGAAGAAVSKLQASAAPTGGPACMGKAGGGGSGDDSALASPSLNLGSGFSTPGFAPIKPWATPTTTSQGQQAAAAAAGANGLSRPPLKGATPYSTFGSQASGMSSSAGTSASGDAVSASDADASPTPAADTNAGIGLPQTETVTAQSASSSGASPPQGIPLAPGSDASPTPVASSFPANVPQAPSNTTPPSHQAGHAVAQPFVASVSPGTGLPNVFTTSQTLGIGSSVSRPDDADQDPRVDGRNLGASQENTGSGQGGGNGSVEAARMMDAQRSASERTLMPGKLLSAATPTPTTSTRPTAKEADTPAGTTAVDKADAAAQTDAEPPASDSATASSSPPSAVDKLATELNEGAKVA